MLRKVKLKLLLETKVIAGVGLEPNPVWAACCKTWLKFEIKAFRCRRKKIEIKKNGRVVDVPLVGRHVVKHG